MCLLHIYLSICMILDHLVMDHRIPISHLDLLCSTKLLLFHHRLMGFGKSCDRRELHEMLKNCECVVIEPPIFDRCFLLLFSFGILDNQYLEDLTFVRCKSTILMFLLNIIIQSMFSGSEEQYMFHMLLMVQLYQLPCRNQMMLMMFEHTQI